MKVYGGGRLCFGRYRQKAKDAMNYVLRLPGVIGCSTPAEGEENVCIATIFAPLSEPQMRDLESKTLSQATAYTAYKRPVN